MELRRMMTRFLLFHQAQDTTRGYFCATVGAVDEKTVMAYIESQKWDQDDEGFKVTAPTQP
jgi:REP element-mobilizing transposase RayT